MKVDGDHVRLVRIWVAECCAADASGPTADHLLYPHFDTWASERFEFDAVRSHFWTALDVLGHATGDALRIAVHRPESRCWPLHPQTAPGGSWQSEEKGDQ